MTKNKKEKTTAKVESVVDIRKLTDIEKFYISQHYMSKKPEELAEILKCSVELVMPHIPVGIHPNQLPLNDKGTTMMTETSSMYADEHKAKVKNNDSDRIWRKSC